MAIQEAIARNQLKLQGDPRAAVDSQAFRLASSQADQNIVNAISTNQIGLQRNASMVASNASFRISGIRRELREELNRRLPIILSNSYDRNNRTRIQRLSRSISRKIAEQTSASLAFVDAELDQIIAATSEFQQDVYSRFSGGAVGLRRASVSRVRTTVRNTPFFAGVTPSEAIRNFNNALERRVSSAIAAGVNAGSNITDVTRAIAGSPGTNGILGSARTFSRTLTRTQINFAANEARLQMAAANNIEKYRYVATLDSRTSDVCAGFDGQVFTVGEGPTPPLHPNCRSTIIYELGNARVGQRASAAGPVRASTTYASWLRNQPRSFVNGVLGPTKSRLFLDGGVPLTRFSASDYSPLTLDQLRSTNRETFERLGL